MACIELGLSNLRDGFSRNATSFHELQRLANSRGQFFVFFALRAIADKIQGPTMHLMEVREPALCECAQQVQRRGGLVISLDHAARIRLTRFRQELYIVDDVATIARQFLIALFLGRLGTRLRELSGHPANFHHRARRREGQNDRHLQ